MYDSRNVEQFQMEYNDTRAEEPVKNQVSELEDSSIDETLELSTVKDSTLSKSKKYTIQKL